MFHVEQNNQFKLKIPQSVSRGTQLLNFVISKFQIKIPEKGYFKTEYSTVPRGTIYIKSHK